MDIQLRPRIDQDNQFVFDLFSSHKLKELMAEDWPETLKSSLCTMQFNAFEDSFLTEYPNSEDFIITSESNPIGRLVLCRSTKKINIIYISLLPEFQHKGIGSSILNNMIREANLTHKTLYLKVKKDNSAYPLYLNLKFKVMSEDEVEYIMTYTPF